MDSAAKVAYHNRSPRRLGKARQMKNRTFTAILEKEGAGYVALCPELDVASQGDTVEQAMANLREAVDLFLECASETEIKERLHEEVFVTRFEAAYA
jgi:predicted RNase H-like HicB family nuclease